MNVRLRTKWLWVRISSQSLKLQIWCLLRARSSLTFKHTIERGFTLNLVRDMIITYSQMHQTDKYSQHSSIIWPVWLNGWEFVYEIDCELESRFCHLENKHFIFVWYSLVEIGIGIYDRTQVSWICYTNRQQFCSRCNQTKNQWIPQSVPKHYQIIQNS